MMGGAGLVAVIFFLYQRRDKLQLSWKEVIEYVVVCTVFATVLARVLYVIALLPSMKNFTLQELLHQLWNGGIVFYGGLFGVILGIIAVSNYRKRNPKYVLNLMAPAFPLFHAFARVGCLLTGCCYGIECSWGVTMLGEENVIRFPVQLFESGCNILIFVMLIIIEQKKKTSRYNLACYLCTYAICRFVLEFFRGDGIRGIWVTGLSTAQNISLLILFCYAGNYVISGFLKRKTGKVVEE